MSKKTPIPILKGANTAYSVPFLQITSVLCHRRISGVEHYLVRWRTESPSPVPPTAICSWHPLTELTRCLHLVQTYIQQLPKNRAKGPLAGSRSSSPTTWSKKRKRGSHDAEEISRDRSGILTPVLNGKDESHSSSVGSRASSLDADEPVIYNGTLERKDGWIVAKRVSSAIIGSYERENDVLIEKQSNRPDTARVNATTLPTREMLNRAATTPFDQAEYFVRLGFERKLSRLPKLRLENEYDDSTPPLDFEFIQAYLPGEGVYRADPDSFEGCVAPCKPNMGNHMGCEWPRECTCLEYAAVNEDTLQRQDPAKFAVYIKLKTTGQEFDRMGLPKRFPYHAPKAGEHKPQTLVQFYREERHPIYECNVNCKCGPACKSRLVQRGRKVPLTIFKTPNRGWGVYCDEDLIEGEFIDTYLGEIITNEEADRREQVGSKDKQSYLYSLDKFINEDDGLTAENCYVVDGQYKGGPTRFINHSCQPNCRQFTVSYNKNDPRIYDIAFFAVEDILAGTELTFDYQDKDEVEEWDAVAQRERALADPANRNRQPCNCGSRKCRGFLWG